MIKPSEIADLGTIVKAISKRQRYQSCIRSVWEGRVTKSLLNYKRNLHTRYQQYDQEIKQLKIYKDAYTYLLLKKKLTA